MKQKQKAWKWCSKYIRLRDAMRYCREKGIDLDQFDRVEELPGECCSCGKVKSWIRMDAGHFIGRGLGGSSGVYFDERNINLQCKQCNLSHNDAGYLEFMLDKYGQLYIDELKLLHKINSYKYKLLGLEIYYKEAYQRLVKEWKNENGKKT